MTDSVLADNFRSILNNLNRASINSNKMLTDLTKFSSKLNAEGSLFNDLATDTTMVTDLKATLESFRSSANNTEALTAKLNEISAKLDDPNNSLGLLLNDPEFAQTLKSTLENTDSATYNLNRGLEALEYTWPFRKGFKRKAKAEEEGN